MLKLGTIIKPSKHFILLNFIALITCFFIIIFLPIGLLSKVSLVVFLIIYSGAIVYSSGLLLSKYSLRALYLTEYGWFIRTKTDLFKVFLRGDSTLTSWLMVLRFQDKDRNKRFSYLILRDSLKSISYRELMVAVRFSYLP